MASSKTLKKTVADFQKAQRAGEGARPVRVGDQGRSLPSRGPNLLYGVRCRAVSTAGYPPLWDDV